MDLCTMPHPTRNGDGLVRSDSGGGRASDLSRSNFVRHVDKSQILITSYIALCQLPSINYPRRPADLPNAPPVKCNTISSTSVDFIKMRSCIILGILFVVQGIVSFFVGWLFHFAWTPCNLNDLVRDPVPCIHLPVIRNSYSGCLAQRHGLPLETLVTEKSFNRDLVRVSKRRSFALVRGPSRYRVRVTGMIHSEVPMWRRGRSLEDADHSIRDNGDDDLAARHDQSRKATEDIWPESPSTNQNSKTNGGIDANLQNHQVTHLLWRTPKDTRGWNRLADIRSGGRMSTFNLWDTNTRASNTKISLGHRAVPNIDRPTTDVRISLRDGAAWESSSSYNGRNVGVNAYNTGGDHGTNEAADTDEDRSVDDDSNVASELDSLLIERQKHRKFLKSIQESNARPVYSSYVRRRICATLKAEKFKYWWTLFVLYGIEWPSYAFAKDGGRIFLDVMLARVREFRAPPDSSEGTRRIYRDLVDCGMPEAFEEGLRQLNDISSTDELIRVYEIKERDAEFRKVLQAVGDVHLPVDATNCLAHVFQMVGHAAMLAWGQDLFLGKNKKYRNHVQRFSAEELYMSYVKEQSIARRHFHMLLLMSSVLKQNVTLTPSKGIILLTVKDSVHPNGSSNDSFVGIEDMKTLQERVTKSIRVKLESALERFNSIGKTPSSKSSIIAMPEVRVSGFYAKQAGGQVIERGLVGIEIGLQTMSKVKAELPQNALLIQVTLFDSWADLPEKEWPDILSQSNKVVSAHTATQLMKAQLLWDPSLSGLDNRCASFVYSAVTPIYDYEYANIHRNNDDADIQVIMMQDIDGYRALSERHGGILRYVRKLVTRKPLGHEGIVRHFDPSRITLKGTAQRVNSESGPKFEIYRRGHFGMGLSYEKRKQVEKFLREGHILVHLRITGLGTSTMSDQQQELSAWEILSRLVQRGRGTFEFHVDIGFLPSSMSPLAKSPEAKCSNMIPDWVFALTIASIVLIFLLFLVVLIYSGRINVPWWLSCWCSRSSPWEIDKAEEYVSEYHDSDNNSDTQRKNSIKNSSEHINYFSSRLFDGTIRTDNNKPSTLLPKFSRTYEMDMHCGMYNHTCYENNANIINNNKHQTNGNTHSSDMSSFDTAVTKTTTEDC